VDPVCGRPPAEEGGVPNLSDSQDASDENANSAMDEDDLLFAGDMDIDEGGPSGESRLPDPPTWLVAHPSSAPFGATLSRRNTPALCLDVVVRFLW